MTTDQLKQLRLDIVSSWDMPLEEAKALYTDMARAVKVADL